MQPFARSSFIAIARIARPRGIRGEVIADLCTDFPSRFYHLREVWLEFADRERRIFRLEAVRFHRGRPVLKFEGINSIPEASRLSGAYIEVEEALAVALPEGSYFDHDLVGCTVITVGGEILGKAEEVLRIVGNTQLVVQGPKGEILIPAVGEICKEISIAKKEILVDVPEGLIELNR